MENNKLENWISEIQSEVDKETAYIQLFMYGGAVDESAIKANRDGLLLYAQMLIKAATEINKVEENESIQLSKDYHNWIDNKSDIWFHYVQKKNGFSNNEEPETLKDKFLGYFFMGIFLFIVAMIILGLWTFLSYLK